MKYFSDSKIKLSFGKPMFEHVSKTKIKCTMPYKICIPSAFLEDTGVRAHFAFSSDTLNAVCMSELNPTDTFDEYVGRKLAEARSVSAAYKYADAIIDKMKELSFEYQHFVTDFTSKSKKAVRHNNKFISRLISADCKKSQPKTKSPDPYQLTLFSSEDFVNETEIRKRKSNGRDTGPVICVERTNENDYKVKAVAVTRLDMEKVTGVDSRYISHCSKYLTPFCKNKNMYFYCVNNLDGLFQYDNALKNVLTRTAQMVKQNNGRKVGNKPVPYIYFRNCYLHRSLECKNLFE